VTSTASASLPCRGCGGWPRRWAASVTSTGCRWSRSAAASTTLRCYGARASCPCPGRWAGSSAPGNPTERGRRLEDPGEPSGQVAAGAGLEHPHPGTCTIRSHPSGLGEYSYRPVGSTAAGSATASLNGSSGTGTCPSSASLTSGTAVDPSGFAADLRKASSALGCVRKVVRVVTLILCGFRLCRLSSN
jgi:hypothetical protein